MNASLYNHDCPALMSDGRLVTDYRPSCTVNGLISYENRIKSSYDYKLFAQRNGEKLQQLEREFAKNKNSCYSCGGFYQADPNKQIDYWNQYSNWIQTSKGGSSGGGCPISEAFKR